jgi:GNAT superfamily N-acetyltransferase
MFRKFANENEEQKAADIIATIDQGEKWIFNGAEGSSDFGGFIDKLFYCYGDTYGTFCSCIYSNSLRLQIGFNTDIPAEICDELLKLFIKARSHINSFTSVWYPPNNTILEQFLFTKLPWKAQGHKTHELTFMREKTSEELKLPENISIVPFSDTYIEAVCTMLDKSLSHTFDNPDSSIFLKNKEHYSRDWNNKAQNGDCCIMLEKGEVVGAYILKGSEIDFIAISTEKQGKGLGSILLNHAKEHILATRKDNPYLYCIEKIPNALRFYLREGMKITGYSGYMFFEEVRVFSDAKTSPLSPHKSGH